ncbi:uncharacterized protein ATC70_000438 [Mucor velutinosus]|uniref:Reverse transcriptase zinc-binding domain-containing protein n=1 Tax=Mucor velutinosus TaxID=708070 RepID=A0AAN7DHZ5_9FUNG|nr:hypothetical protein ATC70_000438 [Mucor velutinosus]
MLFIEIDNQDQQQFQLITRTACSKPHTLTRLHRAIIAHQLTLQLFVHNNSTGDPDFQPFVDPLIYQQQQILKLANRDLRFVMLDMANLDVGCSFSNHLSKQQWQTFYKNNMHYSARNLWYRMIHKQSSNKLVMSQLHLKHAESDECELCYKMEDAKHLLISCVHKLDVWDSSFNEFLGYPKSADPHLIYKSITLFKLDRYFIYNLDIHITIFDLLATIMRIIWRNHYQQLYNHMHFDSIQISRQIRTEVLRLSNLKQLSY